VELVNSLGALSKPPLTDRDRTTLARNPIGLIPAPRCISRLVPITVREQSGHFGCHPLKRISKTAFRRRYILRLAQVTNPQVFVCAEMILPSAGSLHTRNGMRRRLENEKTPTVVIRKICEAILDEIFLPGDWLPELGLAERFHVSRSPIREALHALEKEGTVVTESSQRGQGEASPSEGTFGHCGNQNGPHYFCGENRVPTSLGR
jgi:hypothetical protein